MRFVKFFCFIFLIVSFGCNEHPEMESKFQTVTADTTKFYPLKNYLVTQIKKVDEIENKIYRVTVNNGNTDSGLISKEAFDSLAKKFTEYDITDSTVKKFYS